MRTLLAAALSRRVSVRDDDIFLLGEAANSSAFQRVRSGAAFAFPAGPADYFCSVLVPGGEPGLGQFSR